MNCPVNGEHHIYQFDGVNHVCACGKVMKFNDKDKTWSEK